MASKLFYQIAADEVAAGHIDKALWIKVSADMANATLIARQAKYIQLRAQDLATENQINKLQLALPRVKRWAKQIFGWMAGVGVILLIVAFIYSKVESLRWDYQTIVGGPALYSAFVATYHASKQDRDRMLKTRAKVGNAYEFADGSTVGENLDWSRSAVVGNYRSALSTGDKIQEACGELHDVRGSFLGGILDHYVRNPKAGPICSLWMSDQAPTLTLDSF